MAQLEDPCGSNSRFVCEKVFDWTDNETLARLTDWFIDRPFRIIAILVAAWFLSRFFGGVVTRFAERVANRQVPEAVPAQDLKPGEKRLRSRVERLTKLQNQQARAKQRALTLGDVLRSVVSIVVWVIAIMLVLSELNLNLAPLIASAGIAGIAFGFGAQSVVRDFLAGIFVIIEDQYGVGDVIDVGDAIGSVEEVSLRTTEVRDVSGVLWIVPNGEIKRVGNYSQLWSMAILDIEVAYDTDIDEASAVIKRVLDEVWQEGREEATITAEPEVQGIQSFGDSAVVIRAAVKTDPSEQWAVARYVRGRLKTALDEAGIEIPFPQRTVWLKHEQGESSPSI